MSSPPIGGLLKSEAHSLSPDDGLGTRAGRQLLKDPLEMGFDRFRGDPELAGYLFVRSSRTYKCDDSPLSIREQVSFAFFDSDLVRARTHTFGRHM